MSATPSSTPTVSSSVAGGNPAAFDDPALTAWLRHLARRGITLGGISGGPYLLARAGLLTGRRCTLHWEHVPAFEERYPDIEVVRLPLRDPGRSDHLLGRHRRPRPDAQPDRARPRSGPRQRRQRLVFAQPDSRGPESAEDGTSACGSGCATRGCSGSSPRWKPIWKRRSRGRDWPISPACRSVSSSYSSETGSASVFTSIISPCGSTGPTSSAARAR